MADYADEIDKGLANALKVLEQAKARVANERKKQNERRRKAENRHKYMMGGIVVKYFPECYHFDEKELNSILSAALAAEECKRVIENIVGMKNIDESAKKQDKESNAGNGELLE